MSLLGIMVGGYDPCGEPAGCYCSTPVLNQIQCTGEISEFPVFDDVIKPGVVSIVFYGTNITTVPPFDKEEWDRLKYINFVETDMMSCDAIAELWRPGLRIFSECITKKEECKTNRCNGTGICLIIMVLVIMVASSAIVYLLTTRKGSWTLPVPQTSPDLPMTSSAINKSDDSVLHSTWV